MAAYVSHRRRATYVVPPQVCTGWRNHGKEDVEAMPAASGPFSLALLLPAGTIELKLSSLRPFNQLTVCAEDGWHHSNSLSSTFSAHLRKPAQDIPFLQELEFLDKHRFLLATWRVHETLCLVFVRIYIIPYDLANVQGNLRIRDEGTVLVHARKYMHKLLAKLSRNPEAWYARSSHTAYPPQWFLPPETDMRTMADIYGDLPSPSPDSAVLAAIDEIKGMRSKLYSYQRRSVATMLDREVHSKFTPSPLYIALPSISGDKQFYLQPTTMEILAECPTLAQSRGGVLCEELGTGKTVMVLALVLTTLDQLPSPEEAVLGPPRLVMTPLAFRTFPSEEHKAARRRAATRHTSTRVPSLCDVMLHHASVHPQSLGASERILDQAKATSWWRPLSMNTPFYHHYHDEPPPDARRPQRRAGLTTPRTMYLSAATLVAVPPNLLAQWDREILKHVQAPLRVLCVRRSTRLPAARVLAAEYDIILITHPKFSAEASKLNDKSLLHHLPQCHCPPLKGSNVPDCNCDGHKDVSPLLQVRWKRLVVDEGHVSSTALTNFSEFVAELSAERRWIVTGTPTANLLGLSFGNGDTVQTHGDRAMELQYPADEDALAHAVTQSNRWKTQNNEDLKKLAVMMTRLLRMSLFVTQPDLFKAQVSAPLLDADGPRPGAIRVLQQAMQMCMIRHRIEDVEKDIVLPPLTQEVVLLDLDQYAAKTYNALQAVISINAVDSERVDMDYLFHQKNADALREVMQNMSQYLFWGVSDNLFNIDELVRDAESKFENARKRQVSDADLLLLQQAYKHLNALHKDWVWRQMHDHEDVPFRVAGVVPELYHSWARSSKTTDMSFMHPDRLIELRSIVLSRPRISLERLEEFGVALARADDQHRRYFKEMELAKARKNKGKNKMDKAPAVSQKATLNAKSLKTSQVLEEVRKEFVAAQERLVALSREEDPDIGEHSAGDNPVSLIAGVSRVQAELLSSSPVLPIQIGDSASAKLNYILQDVLRYGSTDKFLIFSESPLTLAHIREGLTLLGVKCLQFTTDIEQQAREHVVVTFETSEKFRVLLMELKHGARGLNLVSASRVIFAEPVWQPDVESQAIKRAHRIGQTRPISVKTLAIRDTCEQNMVSRREALKGRAGKLPDMMEEVGMRSYIENPKFLTASSTPSQETSLNFPLLKVPVPAREIDAAVTVDAPQRISPIIKIRIPHLSERTDPRPPSTGPPPKKRLRFAEP